MAPLWLMVMCAYSPPVVTFRPLIGGGGANLPTALEAVLSASVLTPLMIFRSSAPLVASSCIHFVSARPPERMPLALTRKPHDAESSYPSHHPGSRCQFRRIPLCPQRRTPQRVSGRQSPAPLHDRSVLDKT